MAKGFLSAISYGDRACRGHARYRANYQRHLHVTAIDIDPRAIHMAYIQFSFLHISAHLMVGNALSGEIQDHWFAPAHILGGWTARFALRLWIGVQKGPR